MAIAPYGMKDIRELYDRAQAVAIGDDVTEAEFEFAYGVLSTIQYLFLKGSDPFDARRTAEGIAATLSAGVSS